MRSFFRLFHPCQACTRDYRPALTTCPARHCQAPAEHLVRYDDGETSADLRLCSACLDVAHLELGRVNLTTITAAPVASIVLETYLGFPNRFSKKAEPLWRLRVLDEDGTPTFADLGENHGHRSKTEVQLRGEAAAAAIGLKLTEDPLQHVTSH